MYDLFLRCDKENTLRFYFLFFCCCCVFGSSAVVRLCHMHTSRSNIFIVGSNIFSCTANRYWYGETQQATTTLIWNMFWFWFSFLYFIDAKQQQHAPRPHMFRFGGRQDKRVSRPDFRLISKFKSKNHSIICLSMFKEPRREWVRESESQGTTYLWQRFAVIYYMPIMQYGKCHEPNKTDLSNV